MYRLLIIAFAFSLFAGLHAQDYSSYMMVMVKQKKALNMAQSELDYQNLASSFERIANAQTDQWHPLYYAAFCYINMSLRNNDPAQKDNYLDNAQAMIEKALEIYPDESELYVLQGLLYQARIQVNVGQRKLEYSVKANDALLVAKDYNPENPRIYYLMALNALQSPEIYDTATETACANLETAMEQFTVYRPQHVLSPTWGGERNAQLKAQYCSDQN
jgi:tetratricopeptide (TPR) repeat protein